MSYIQGEHRVQATLFPEVLDDYVGAGSVVRVIDRFVDYQDLRGLGFERWEPAETGRPGYDPRVLLKLYVYGYLNRVRSSRRLEREAQRNIEVLWLLGKLVPDHKTIADFRRTNGEGIRGLCRAFSAFCVEQELMRGEWVAIDGSKFAGVNSAARNVNAQQLARRLERVEQQIAGYLEELEQNDAAEAGVEESAPEAVRAALQELEVRKAQLQEQQRQLAASGERQLSLTDADARSMKAGGGVVVGYNVQIAVDGEHKLIAEFEVTNAGNDRGQLATQAQAAKQVLGVSQLEVVADGGYAHGSEYARCEAAGITAYVPDCGTNNNEKRGRFGKARFVYDAAADRYRCPAGEWLSYVGSRRCGQERERVYRTSACGGCALRAQCTADQHRGREITRAPHADAVERMAARVQTHPDKIKKRKELAEHPFGTIKRGMQQGYFLMKRLPKVTTEMSLTVLCYNLRRVLNILGPEKLLQSWAPA